MSEGSEPYSGLKKIHEAFGRHRDTLVGDFGVMVVAFTIAGVLNYAHAGDRGLR